MNIRKMYYERKALRAFATPSSFYYYFIPPCGLLFLIIYLPFGPFNPNPNLCSMTSCVVCLVLASGWNSVCPK